VLELDEAEVTEAAGDVARRFEHRHVAFGDMIEANVGQIVSRLDPAEPLSAARRYLLGACFTHEFAIEAAALCNPSIVLHPDQNVPSDRSASGRSGEVRFVLSVRGIGEGHRSTIGFREGTVTAAGAVSIDSPSPHAVASSATPGLHHRESMQVRLAAVDGDRENASYVLDQLPSEFDDAALEEAIDELESDRATRRGLDATIGHLRSFAASTYRASFPSSSPLSSRVLWPYAPNELHGMEDARFVRFVADDGEITYFGTYTAFDGRRTAQHLLETQDFLTFGVSPMAGAAATGKGLALFPRKVGGRYVALSRSDRETNAVSFSDDVRCWSDRQVVQTPARPWEILQLGNCGSPIETEAGWLVLTHGVGAMRTYHLGALLLDLDDPSQVLARSRDPILSPEGRHRDGYVPNVVYTCGALAHGDVLVIPFGMGDQSIGMVTTSIDALLASLEPERSRL
jgi:predicted GH43/DUF377 family glycosyl hydrolase